MSLETNNTLDREQFLEEIRRRAEEAELARIEAEELKFTSLLNEDSLGQISPRPTTEVISPTRLETQPGEPSRGNDEQKALPGRNQILLLRPVDANLQTTRADNRDIQQAKPQSTNELKEETRATSGQSRSSHRLQQLLQSARENYQNERYDRALEDLVEAEALERDHGEVGHLRAEIEKAKSLASRVEEEELRFRTKEQAEEQVFIPLPRRQSEADVSKERAAIPPDAEVETPKLPLEVDQPKASLRKWKVMFVLLPALAGGIVAYQFIRDRYFPETIRVLVLPARTSDAELYITDGLTEELISRLARIPYLHVFAPRTAFALRGADKRKSVQALGADYVVQLKVEQQGERFHLQVSLANEASSEQELVQEFSGSRSELGTFCAAFVPKLAGMLGKQAEPTNDVAVTNAAALNAYLLGRHALQHLDALSLDSAASAFEQSCAADPKFADAAAALGWTRLLQFEAKHDTSKDVFTSAIYHLRRAMNLGARSSEVYRLWGQIEYYNDNFAQAIERLTTATLNAPSDAEAQIRLALAHLRSGNWEEALRAGEKAASIDPHNSRARETYGLLLMMNGDNENALRQFEMNLRNHAVSTANAPDEFYAALVATNNHETVLDILKERAVKQPDSFTVFYDLGRALQLAGKSKQKWEEALLHAKELIERSLSIDSGNARAYAYLGLVNTRLGAFSEGISAGKHALAIAKDDTDTQYLVARIYALQRDQLGQGFAQLSSAVRKRLVLRRLLDLDLQNLRNESDFLRRITTAQK